MELKGTRRIIALTIMHGLLRKICFLILCYKVNLTLVPRCTWWIDSSVITYVNVSMQGCLSCREPGDCERYIYVSDGKMIQVQIIGKIIL